MALHFSKEEFHKRKLDTLKSMKEQNLDALLMFVKSQCFGLQAMIPLVMYFSKH